MQRNRQKGRGISSCLFWPFSGEKNFHKSVHSRSHNCQEDLCDQRLGNKEEKKEYEKKEYEKKNIKKQE